ncbi:LamB/YcsF family protein [Propionibacterium sp.]|uniref:LamB/YcsF family protein n=1 Tax=Propionibacterium sp. TaxID=1977903 RepID=UPI0039EB3F82
MISMDLNSDMGESFGRWSLGDDEAMLDTVTSANIACGFHAGDPIGILTTTRAAAERGVVVGAHPAYRDLAGFGRRAMEVAPAELTADVLYQIAALDGLARSAGTKARYVKPHGALYNRIALDPGPAKAVVEAIKAYDPGLAVMALAGSVFARTAADAGLRVMSEAFADRGYRPDGTLVSRREPGAVLSDPRAVIERIVRLAEDGTLVAADDSVITLQADSVCVHSDSPGALAMAKAVREGLTDEGISVASPLNQPEGEADR